MSECNRRYLIEKTRERLIESCASVCKVQSRFEEFGDSEGVKKAKIAIDAIFDALEYMDTRMENDK